MLNPLEITFGYIEIAPPDTLPAWLVLVLILKSLLIFPLWYLITYVFQAMYPILAMVEDESQPPSSPGKPSSTALDRAPRPATSSVRSIKALLAPDGAGRLPPLLVLLASHLRGLPCLLAIRLAHHYATTFVDHFLWSCPASLASHILLAPLATVWVHVLLVAPGSPSLSSSSSSFSFSFSFSFFFPYSPRALLSRAPALGPTLRATLRPILLLWAAEQLAIALPSIVNQLLPGRRTPLKQTDLALLLFEIAFFSARPRPHAPAERLLLYILAATLRWCLVLPAQLVLARARAALLSAGEATIVPVDRSFAELRDWASVSAALSAFSRSSWRRLIRVEVVGTAAVFLFALSSGHIPAMIALLTIGASR
ncbi:hypothetical protein ESCO_002993 [Escovopsis weberi]|uniref:Uncharacterized protein n=1 Tax=Escovopsis weberi TaxID=150374 RepID=A0A0M8N0P3_ESCWE|nr:hypothetical protein ESCO_002993 [Escovopsis weberi]